MAEKHEGEIGWKFDERTPPEEMRVPNHICRTPSITEKVKMMAKITVARALVKALEMEKSKFIFGLPGFQVAPVYDALYDSAIKPILVRHEQGAAYMADAYAKFTSEPGICLATVGPGATNLVTGICVSWTDSTPVLALTGQQPLLHLGKGVQQELNHMALFRSITKWSTQLTKPERITETIRNAFRIALRGRPGPVHVDLPWDTQEEVIDAEFVPPEKSRSDATLQGGEEAINRAAELLIRADRPVILAGGGCHYAPMGDASSEILELAEHLGIPVATTFNGRGVIPDDHPLSVGRTGVFTSPYTNDFISNSDVLMAIGCRFSGVSTSNWSIIGKSTKIIHVDIDPREIGKNYPVEVGIVGDARSVLRKLVQQIKKACPPRNYTQNPWAQELKLAKKKWNEHIQPQITSDSTPLKPQRVVHEIRKFFDRDTVFTVDAGSHRMWATILVEVYGPKTWIQSGSFGPMGYAVPGAIACKLAGPEKTVVAICGDGGFLMTAQELSTAVQYNAPITVCIMNDEGLGAIRHYQHLTYKRTICADYKNPNFTKLAEAYNCQSARVEKPNQIRSALKAALKANREGMPAVIDFLIDPWELLPGW